MSFKAIQALYEDDDQIVFNKPDGLLAVPADTGKEISLNTIVNQQYPSSVGLYPAHRLDRHTTGVILFAKGKENRDKLMLAFKERKVKKQYIAFVHGRMERREGTIRFPIEEKGKNSHYKTAVRSALTHYRVREYHKDFSVVDVMPITGRTNQIRIHLAKLGHPLVGEDKYAFRKDFALRFRRTALHAAKLEWPHPRTGKMLVAIAEMPADMQEFLEKNS